MLALVRMPTTCQLWKWMLFAHFVIEYLLSVMRLGILWRCRGTSTKILQSILEDSGMNISTPANISLVKEYQRGLYCDIKSSCKAKTNTDRVVPFVQGLEVVIS